MQAASWSNQGPLSLICSDILIFDDYFPEENKSKKYLDRLLGFLQGRPTSTYSFIKTIKAVLERWNEQLAARYLAETAALHTFFDQPPLHILADESKRLAYLYLFATCAASRIDLSVSTYHAVLSNMADKAFKVANVYETLIHTDKVARLAIPCYALLCQNTQSKMQGILDLLQQQPDITFADVSSERFRIFQLAADCFSGLDIHAKPLPLDLPVRQIHSIVAPDAHTRPLADRLADTAPLNFNAEDWTLMDEQSKSSALLSDTVICALLNASAANKHTAETKHKLEQFRTIHNFGNAFLMQYGEIVIADTAAAVIETIKQVKRKQELIQLVLGALKGLSGSYACFLPFLHKLLDRYLPDMILTTSQYAVQTLKNRDFGEELSCLLIQTWTPLCFFEAPQSLMEKKNFLLEKMRGLGNFFADFNQALRTLPKLVDGDIQTEEQLLIVEMSSKMQARKLPQLIPKHKNTHTIKENLFDAVEAMLKQTFSSGDPIQGISVFALTSILTHTLNRIFSADGLCILIDLLFEHPLDVLPKQEPLPLPLDTGYTDALALEIRHLMAEIFKLAGLPSHFDTIFQKVVMDISPIQKIAKKMHAWIEEIIRVKKMNDMVVMPILLMNQLLYGQTLPTFSAETQQKKLFNYLEMDASSMQTLRQKVDKDMHSKPVEYFRAFIDQRLSSITKLLIQSVSETLCQSLASRLYRLSKQEMIVKMLISYLILGKEQIKTP